MPPAKDARIPVGVSTCLLGQAVRYDGGHKHDAFVAQTLAEHFSFVPVCPEVEIGLGIPRETLRLVRADDGVHMIGKETGKDHTSTMRSFARKRASELARLGLCGYILKKDSPSCGMERVRVYTDKGPPTKKGRGLFAEELMRELSLLPVEEEGRLNDAILRENFIERVFAYQRLQSLFRPRWTIADLVRFQTSEKLLLMAHAPSAQRELGRLVAGATALGREVIKERYEATFMGALAKPAPRRRHVNVLQHAVGHFKRALDTEAKGELAEIIEDYRRGLIPLVVPLTLIRHYVRRFDALYLRGQTYLEPHPRELMLRNHV